jgi:26 proteasome complex subunit DSS1
MASNAQQPPTDSNKPELGLLEEDDEFEEFPVEDWGADKEDAQDDHQWEDNWDDDNLEDDFSKQLRYSSPYFAIFNVIIGHV